MKATSFSASTIPSTAKEPQATAPAHRLRATRDRHRSAELGIQAVPCLTRPPGCLCGCRPALEWYGLYDAWDEGRIPHRAMLPPPSPAAPQPPPPLSAYPTSAHKIDADGGSITSQHGKICMIPSTAVWRSTTHWLPFEQRGIERHVPRNPQERVVVILAPRPDRPARFRQGHPTNGLCGNTSESTGLC